MMSGDILHKLVCEVITCILRESGQFKCTIALATSECHEFNSTSVYPTITGTQLHYRIYLNSFKWELSEMQYSVITSVVHIDTNGGVDTVRCRDHDVPGVEALCGRCWCQNLEVSELLMCWCRHWQFFNLLDFLMFYELFVLLGSLVLHTDW